MELNPAPNSAPNPAQDPGLSAALEVPLTAARRRNDGRALVGSRCRSCAAVSWPSRSICHRCGTAGLVEETFSGTGDLITYTTVHVKRPGLPVPYSLGQARLDDDGPLVFGQVKGLPDEPITPLRVGIVVAEKGRSPAYWFEPLAAAAEPVDGARAQSDEHRFGR